jgi:hypothetical protein
MMLTMKPFMPWTRLAAAAALATAAIGCGDVVRDGQSPMFLVIDALEAQAGAASPGPFTGTLHSDLITNVTTPAPCSTSAPCPTIFSDSGRVTLHVSPKDITTLGTISEPSSNNQVTINRYRVDYRRADGRNTPGVDVPYGFDGAFTGTVPINGNLTVNFELVRHVAKEESPLMQFRFSDVILSTIADITFYGQDLVGNEISARGSLLVDFGNFGDK